MEDVKSMEKCKEKNKEEKPTEGGLNNYDFIR